MLDYAILPDKGLMYEMIAISVNLKDYERYIIKRDA